VNAQNTPQTSSLNPRKKEGAGLPLVGKENSLLISGSIPDLPAPSRTLQILPYIENISTGKSSNYMFIFMFANVTIHVVVHTEITK
jgi:hypothetical protein